MDYALAKELKDALKDAGFPEMDGWIEGASPTLSELIDACEKPLQIIVMPNGYVTVLYPGGKGRMEYVLTKELKDAGFQTNPGNRRVPVVIDERASPTLSELIEACNTVFLDISKLADGWGANDHYHRAIGTTPEEAVARLWLALNKK